MHAYPDGTRAEPDKPRKQLGSEGNVRVITMSTNQAVLTMLLTAVLIKPEALLRNRGFLKLK